MEVTLFIGIDPGLQGGLAALPGSTKIEPRAIIMPVTAGETCPRGILDFLRHYAGICPPYQILCILEWAQAMPKQGITSTFGYGCGWGMIRACLVACNIPHILARPTTWKKVVLADTKKDKEAACGVAHRLYPTINLRRTPACTIDHDGMADAVCLAIFAATPRNIT